MTLTESIATDLRQRLTQGGANVDLRLESLAEYYEVSTQPVRLALNRLREEGRLSKSRQGGFYFVSRTPRPGAEPHMAESPPSIETPRLRPKTAASELYRSLSALLVRLSLGGSAEFVREEAVASQFGVSRSLAREALQRARGEGWVEHVSRRGWRVRAFSPSDLGDFLQVREVLEVRALTLAWPRLERERIEHYLVGNSPRAPKPDNGLHGYWIETANNRYISGFFNQHAPFFGALFDWEDHDRAAARQSKKQHRAILESILRNDLPAALRFLVIHIHENHPVLSNWAPRPTSR